MQWLSKNDYLCNRITDFVSMNKKESIAKWIEARLYRGFYTFTYADVKNDFLSYEDSYIKLAINRLVKSKTIISPTKGFYVIVPVEYALSGLVPPTFYIDQMMAYLKRGYYIGLLNAAAFYGAAHQRPQSFTVFNDGASLRDGNRSGIMFDFIKSKRIIPTLLTSHKTKLGSIKVSCPELTAIDLIENQDKVGGLNRVCTVLNELVDSLEFDKVDISFYTVYGIPVYQRLGYILEAVLEENDKADSLYAKIKSLGMTFRKVPFKIGKDVEGCEIDSRWKIIINQEIEIDE